MYLNNVYEEAYISEVARQYQQGTVLSQTVSQPKKIIGYKAYFPKSYGIVAHKSNKGDNVMYLNGDWEDIPCETESYEAPQIVYDYDEHLFSFNEAVTLAKNASDSIGRARDGQIILKGLIPTTTPELGGVGEVLNVKLLSKLSTQLDDNNVPDGDRYIVYTPAVLLQLLNDDKATNSDYAAVKALIKGDIESFMGFKFVKIGKRKELSLPLNVSDKTVTCYAYHKDAVGSAVVQEQKTYIERDASKSGWKHMTKVRIGSCLIENDGVIPFIVTTDNS
ncbi:MAG: hypothetical protein LBC92_00375 [Rickettsiales bacterium]|jgi:hypothetical protein|nr:hypothetical protein [Rickettsiales bacterium]